MTEYPEDEDPRNFEQQAEELSGENRKAAQPLIDVFGEQLVRKLFAKSWQLREEALGEVEDEVLNNQRKYNREDAFVNAIGAVRFAIQDKMAQVIQRACLLLQSTCEGYPNVGLDGALRSAFSSYADPILQTLTEKIGDNLQKIRQRADDAYYAAAGHPQFGIKLCLSYLTNDVPAPAKTKNPKGKKPVLTSKQLKAKYELLRKLLESYHFSPDQQVLATKYAVKGIQHTQNDVRAPAYECMCELYRQMGGDEISKYYEGLRQASLDTLLTKFQEIDENQGKPTKQPKK